MGTLLGRHRSELSLDSGIGPLFMLSGGTEILIGKHFSKRAIKDFKLKNNKSLKLGISFE